MLMMAAVVWEQIPVLTHQLPRSSWPSVQREALQKLEARAKFGGCIANIVILPNQQQSKCQSLMECCSVMGMGCFELSHEVKLEPDSATARFRGPTEAVAKRMQEYCNVCSVPGHCYARRVV